MLFLAYRKHTVPESYRDCNAAPRNRPSVQCRRTPTAFNPAHFDLIMTLQLPLLKHRITPFNIAELNCPASLPYMHSLK